MTDDDWVNLAMKDDSLVADVLLRLRHDRRPPPRPEPNVWTHQLDWTVRQRRSKSTQRHVKSSPTRASPTTPLSWNGATSPSGGGGAAAATEAFEEFIRPSKPLDAAAAAAADGFEEFSRQFKPLDAARSKDAAITKTTTIKRSRKKKTLAELKEEESLLLKERSSLKNELATLRLNVDKKRATNESLKRMKLDVQSMLDLKTVEASVPSEAAISNRPLQTEACCNLDTLPLASPSKCSSKVQEIQRQETLFSLPDLNMPFEEDSGSEVLYRMS